jgi:hypothetical protein
VAQGLNSEAAKYFSEAVPMLEQLGLLESDPVGYAQYLEFYSLALKESGQSELAVTTLKKSENIISKNPHVEPKFIPINFSAICATVKKS